LDKDRQDMKEKEGMSLYGNKKRSKLPHFVKLYLYYFLFIFSNLPRQIFHQMTAELSPKK